jgi:hypothetical protein
MVKILLSIFTGIIGANQVLKACAEMLSLITLRQFSQIPM